MPAFYEGKRVLVTGATGFIGSALVQNLRVNHTALHVEALSSNSNIADPTQCFERFEELARKGPIDYIFHLAVNAPSSHWLSQNSATAWYTNTLINANIFEARRRYMPAAKMVSALSYSIYDDGNSHFKEDDTLVTSRDSDLAAHSNCKLGILAAQAAFTAQYGNNSVSVVLPTVYGEPRGQARKGRVIDDLIEKFLSAKFSNLPTVKVWGSGKQVRDFLYIDDAVDGLMAASQSQNSPMVNLGSGVGTTISECAAQIAHSVGYEGSIDFDLDEYTGANSRVLNIELAKSELDWTPKVNFSEGIQRTVANWSSLRSNHS